MSWKKDFLTAHKQKGLKIPVLQFQPIFFKVQFSIKFVFVTYPKSKLTYQRTKLRKKIIMINCKRSFEIGLVGLKCIIFTIVVMIMKNKTREKEVRIMINLRVTIRKTINKNCIDRQIWVHSICIRKQTPSCNK